jgi:ribosomal protein L11 methyltransferase
VAAAKRGAALVAGVDCDPEAVRAARRHAALNGVSLRLVLGDGARPFRPSRFDLVLANLTAPLLLDRRFELSSRLGPQGALVLSGFLDSDLAALAAAYRPLGAPVVTTDGEWAALLFRGGRG